MVSGIDGGAAAMKRTAMRRTPKPDKPILGIRKHPTSTPGVFELETLVNGYRWLWPVNCLTEREWDGTCMDWAFKIGRCVKAWHCTVAQRSEPGFFDRVFIFKDRAIFPELKVRYANGRANTTSREQDEFIYAGIAAGMDCRVWTFPDDAFEAWEALTGLPKEECPYWKELRA